MKGDRAHKKDGEEKEELKQQKRVTHKTNTGTAQSGNLGRQ